MTTRQPKFLCNRARAVAGFCCRFRRLLRAVFTGLPALASALVLLLGAGPAATAGAGEWPQLQHDARHTGHTPDILAAPKGLECTWKTDFLAFDPPQHVYRTVQVIGAGGKLFVPTQEGNLYALDPADGKTVWRFSGNEGVMHTAGAEAGRVFFVTIKGSVYAVNAADGTQIWRWNNGLRTGFSSAVCLADEKVFVTGRGGDVHALSQADGKELWRVNVGAPVYQTAAYLDGNIYFAAEDMVCYCLAAADGRLVWKSRKLGGTSFRDYYPLAFNGLVIVESQFVLRYTGEAYNLSFPMVWFDPKNPREKAWGEWFAKYRAGLESGDMAPEARQDFIKAQDRQVESFKQTPEIMLRFAFDAKTGEEHILPNCLQTMCGPQPPPVVDRDNMLVMPLFFISGGWGRMDLKTERIIDVLYSSETRWGDNPFGRGNPDENMSLSSTANLIFAVHWQESNAQFTGYFDQDARKWFPLSCSVPAWHIVGRAAHCAQCGNNAASVAFGAAYHQAFNTVHNWAPKE